MRIGVCDDNAAEVEVTCNILHNRVKLDEKFVIKKYSPNELLLDIEENLFDCDILIMDVIFLGVGANGIEIGEKINRFFPACEIIYLSDNLEYATKIYEVRHCYFVLKSERAHMLQAAINKAFHLYMESTQKELFQIVCDRHTVYIDRKEILYIERTERKISIVTQNRTYSCYYSLSKIMKSLGGSMIRIHGSYIVNLDQVLYMSNSFAELKCNIKIPVGKSYEKRAKSAYLKYWSNESG